MSSERRLHAYSVIFAFLTQIRLFVVPGIFVVIGASSRSNDDWWEWQPWMMLFVVPNAVFAIVRYLTYTYTYAEHELVIRSGLLFRRERHIPYARIQNIDAVQNLLHRVLNVVEVKLETGGGETAEAKMSVLPVAAFHEMRARVFADRHAVSPDVAPAAATPLLRLNVPELMLCGLIENRGAVLVAAAFGLVWESGVFDRLVAPMFGESTIGRGVIRNLVRSVFTSATVSWDRLALTIGAFVVLLAVLRMLSMVWAIVRLHGFTLTLVDDDARSEFGLFTRVATTIPLRRVQLLTVREGPLHRYFERVAVKVDTAGGRHEDKNKQPDRESLAPILRKRALAGFVRAIIGVELDGIQWHAPHPRALRREATVWIVMALIVSVGLTVYAGWSALPITPVLVLSAIVMARQQIKHLRWGETDHAVLLSHGWLWRHLIVVRFAKMQVMSLHESPFDRRHAMASFHIDTAGASMGSAFHIRYLARPVAEALHVRLATAAAGTQFKW
jgi:putative membrane protein